jgi:hypothetical protein
MLMKKRKILTLMCAALLGGAVCFLPFPAFAGSCCGGGAATNLILPKYAQGMIDASFDVEKYDGFWNQNGKWTPDPQGSDLRQYRVNTGYAKRLASQWQMGVVVPYVWNDNTYSGLSSRTDGLGDASLNLWYEAVDDTSAWKIRSIRDLTPSILVGPSLLIPTGISPFDDVKSSFDVTGRGFYRIDGNIYVDKTLHPWNASLALSYGTYLERSVNREYGKYVEPYRKKLGDRTSALASLSYIWYLGTGGDTLTGTAMFSYLHEADGTINGVRDPFSGFRKEAVGGAVVYSSTDHDWSVRGSWSHAIQQDGWGENFPTTDIYTLGVRYVFR